MMDGDLFDLNSSALGKKIEHVDYYSPQVLYPIPRSNKRLQLGIDINNPIFQGVDIWNAYEISWLNNNGVPQVCIGRFYFDANSEFMIESKSLKLYLNSFNNTIINDQDAVLDIISKDLSNMVKSQVKVELFCVNDNFHFTCTSGICIDDNKLSIKIHNDVDTSYLQNTSSQLVEEKLYTNLFRSNCLITNQPDWASIVIEYKGCKIDHADLLKYLVSYRNHNGFHEHCVERIFFDINNIFAPSYLSVLAMYTRRGGIDICPFRSTISASGMVDVPKLHRAARQ